MRQVWYRLMAVVPGLIILMNLSNPVAAQSVTGLSGWNIYVDPGHSQTENMGIYGYSEAEKNLGVALNLYQLLMDSTDIDTVFMSRTDSIVNVGLYERCTDANNLGAAWYHSIHSDAGAPAYNSTLLLWGELHNGEPDPPVGGEAMSDIMVNILTAGMRTNTRGSIGDCSFYTWSDWCAQSGGPYLAVNRLTDMPSELSEAGFHTNPRQNQLNMNSSWKRMEARTIYWSILQYHEIERPPVNILQGIVTNMETDTPVDGASVSIGDQTCTTDTYESLFHRYSNDPDLLHNGFYYFAGLPNDSLLEVTVEADGFYSDTTLVTLSDTFFTFLDLQLLSNEPPMITGTVPAENDTAFPAWENIIIDFSRRMDTASVVSAFILNPNTTGTFYWTDNNRRLYFAPDSMEYVTDYTLTILDSSRDEYGHTLDGDADGNPGGDFILSFRTSPSDIIPPVVMDIFPPMGANEIELQPIINITFDEIVADTPPLADFIRLERFSNQTDVLVDLEHFIVGDRSSVNLFPHDPLYADEVYVTRLSPGIEDGFGNATTVYRSYSFATGTYVFDDMLSIDHFESGVTTNWWEPQQSGSTTGIVTDSTGRYVNTELVNIISGSQKSLEVHYGWDVHADAWLIREYLVTGSPRNVTFDDSYLMQVYVFGDGSGNQFRFAVDDNHPVGGAANHEVSPWFTIDWIGWKLVTWNMTEGDCGEWIGDGALDGTLRFDSIQLTHTENGAPFGRMIFDDLRVARKTFLETSPTTGLPREFQLGQNYPNPFNPVTTIPYQLPGSGEISMKVFDLRGRLVTTLVEEYQSSGWYYAKWDGRDKQGRNASSGIYVYTLESPWGKSSGRMLLLK